MTDAFTVVRMKFRKEEHCNKQGRQCTYKVKSWRVRVTTDVMETQQCVPFVLLTYICCCQQCSKYWQYCHGSRAMLPYKCRCRQHETQLESSCKVLDFFVRFQQSPQHQFSRKCVQWEPRSWMRTDRRADTTKLTDTFRECA